ncbi:MAG: hydroxyisourate hydrolase [Corynebacterium sp.]|nr:hydroxyisourate hydrolase [Corynebacterium sp.]
MTSISTHILDTSTGQPASGVAISLHDASGELAATITDNDGRASFPAVNIAADDSKNTQVQTLTLRFVTADYFAPKACLYPEVTITFTVQATASHYHIPLLLSPFGYSTYRGS